MTIDGNEGKKGVRGAGCPRCSAVHVMAEHTKGWLHGIHAVAVGPLGALILTFACIYVRSSAKIGHRRSQLGHPCLFKKLACLLGLLPACMHSCRVSTVRDTVTAQALVQGSRGKHGWQGGTAPVLFRDRSTEGTWRCGRRGASQICTKRRARARGSTGCRAMKAALCSGVFP